MCLLLHTSSLKSIYCLLVHFLTFTIKAENSALPNLNCKNQMLLKFKMELLYFYKDKIYYSV